MGHDEAVFLEPAGGEGSRGIGRSAADASAASELSRLLGRLRQLYPVVYDLGAPTSLAVFETLQASGRLTLLLNLGAAEAAEAVRAPLAAARGGGISAAEALQTYGSFLRWRVWPFLCHERDAAHLLRDESLRRLTASRDGNSDIVACQRCGLLRPLCAFPCSLFVFLRLRHVRRLCVRAAGWLWLWLLLLLPGASGFWRLISSLPCLCVCGGCDGRNCKEDTYSASQAQVIVSS